MRCTVPLERPTSLAVRLIDDEIRDLRYRMHLRGYNPTLW
jgi:hypothetical protein